MRLLLVLLPLLAGGVRQDHAHQAAEVEEVPPLTTGVQGVHEPAATKTNSTL